MNRSRYFREARLDALLDDYPIGDDFLAGPAALDPERLRALQEHRFLKVVARGWEIPFYQRHWGKAGVSPGDIRSLDDIVHLPPFSKSDLMASIAEHPPFGDYHGVALGAESHAALVMQTTSGTTGDPQPIFYGAYDREVQNAMTARAYRLQGLRGDDVVHSVYGFGMVNGGHYIREAIVHFTDALLLSAGTGLETPSRQQVQLMARFGATVLVGFVDYLFKLAGVARDAGLEPGRDIPIRFISGHLGQESRDALSEAWGGAAVYDWYGVGDTGTLAAEGPDDNGLYLFEDAHYVEVLDPDSGAAALLGSGSLCTTALFKDTVYPVIRFNTHDVTELLAPDPDTLGIRFRRMGGFHGRADSMVKLKGINIYPTAVGSVMAGIEGVAGEYYCVVRKVGDQDSLTVVVEVDAGADASALTTRLRERLRERLGVDLGIELVGVGATADVTQVERRQKPIRLVDERS